MKKIEKITIIKSLIKELSFLDEEKYALVEQQAINISLALLSDFNELLQLNLSEEYSEELDCYFPAIVSDVEKFIQKLKHRDKQKEEKCQEQTNITTKSSVS